jgi:MoaA/NifB/PqqE/SkfB family radical SAM enzyme
MKVFNFDFIKVLRVEITTVCNAQCGGCPRKFLPEHQHMSKEIWNNLISEENLINIKRIYFNGNYGDFSCHPDSLRFLSQIKNKNIEIIISTNGSTRNITYWKELAEILCQFKNHLVIFALDGATQETHSMHRVNTNFKKILENAKTFISNNGNASWQFITFKENIHEIAEAQSTAIRLKFKEFLVINSYNPTIGHLHSLETEDYLFYLTKYRYNFVRLTSLNNNFDTVCPWTKLSRLQINVDGSVWPCCWTADITSNYLKVDLESMPTLEKFSIAEIVNSKFYQEYITDQLYNTNSYCFNSCPAKFKDIKFVYDLKKFEKHKN